MNNYEDGFEYDPQRDWWFCWICGCPVVRSFIPKHRAYHKGKV